MHINLIIKGCFNNKLEKSKIIFVLFAKLKSVEVI